MSFGRRAAATRFEHLALWTQHQPKGCGDGKPSKRAVLYVHGGLTTAWREAARNPFLRLDQILATCDAVLPTGEERMVKGVVGLRKLPPRLLKGWQGTQGAWEICEIAAVEDYGPAMLDIAVQLVEGEGVVLDRHSRSASAERMFTASRRSGKYELEPLEVGAVTQHKRATIDSIYRHKPEVDAVWQTRVARLEKAHQVELASFDWTSFPDALQPKYTEDWMQAVFHTFFRCLYQRRGART